MTETSNDTYPVSHQRTGSGAALVESAAMRIVTAAAISTTGVFAGGGLLTQTVIVPYWRDMDPAAFLTHFGKAGPVTGATLFPIELASTLLLGTVLYSAVKGRRRGRLAWGLAGSCMAGTVLLLPIYFLGANTAMLTQSIPLDQVGAELKSWYAWNWVRTGLAFLAVIFSCLGLGHRSRADS